MADDTHDSALSAIDRQIEQVRARQERDAERASALEAQETARLRARQQAETAAALAAGERASGRNARLSAQKQELDSLLANQRLARESRLTGQREEISSLNTQRGNIVTGGLNRQTQIDQAAAQTWQRAFEIAAPLTALTVGYGAGALKARGIEKKWGGFVSASKPQLVALGNQATRLLKPNKAGNIPAAAKARLGAIARTAQGAGLSRLRGPVGVLAAGSFLAEGLVTRVAASYLPNDTAREIGNYVGMGLMAAGAGVLATRQVQRSLSEAVPAVGALSALNQAQAIAGVPSAPVRATQRAVRGATGAVRAAQATRAGVLGAIGAPNLTAARRVAVRGGALGAAAAVGALVANTSAGQSAIQWVAGYWRKDQNTGRQAYVHAHQRRVG